MTTYFRAKQHYEAIAQSEEHKWPNIHWCGDIENCDVCSRPMQDEIYMIDGPATFSSNAPWGNLCITCALKYSPQIGWGKAQLYQKTTDEKWLLIAGGPPIEEF